MRVTYYRQGQLCGWFNDFERAGDCIPTHAHERKMFHNIIVLRGSVDVRGHCLRAGDLITIDDEHKHSVIALEDNTRTLHLLLHTPEGEWMPHGLVEEQ